MTNRIENPLRSDPAFAAARELVMSGALGQLLAVYAVARTKLPIDDALVLLGLPLIDEIVTTLGEAPVGVTAHLCREPGHFEQWSMVVAFSSGLRATIDVGAGFGAAQQDHLDLRVEWSGTERVVFVNPANVAVTVTGARGARRDSAEVFPIANRVLVFADHAFAIAADPPSQWRTAAAVIAAARESSESGMPTRVP